MSKILAVLPLALTMSMGPQIVTAITLVTGKNPVKRSLIFLAAIVLVVTTITFVAFFVLGLAKISVSTGGKSETSKILDYIFAGLLAFLAVRIFFKRKEQLDKPKWMSSIEGADSKRVFVLGLMLYSFMPTDIICMLTVGQYLASHKMHFASVFPFLALTFFIAALPLLSFLMFEKRANKVMPRVQEWLDTHGWVVNEVVIIFILFMVLFG